MTRPARPLRTRLAWAMVALAVAVLVFTGLATLTLARRGATADAVEELEARAPPLAERLEDLADRVEETSEGNGRFLRSLITATLALSDSSVITVTDNGAVLDGLAATATPPGSGTPDTLRLPSDVSVDDLDLDALLAGARQVDDQGRTVFVAEPLGRRVGGTPVLLLTAEVETNPVGRAGPFFLVTAFAAVVAAVLVATYLGRRLTRPLAAMERTAARIASGDLGARVQLGTDAPDDELARLARALDAMAAQLEHSRGLEQAFLLSVSHDLRTPLTSIRGYAEALSDGMLDDPSSVGRAATVIAAEARRLERLVADLLDLARLDAHRFSLSQRPIDAAAVVRDAVAAFRPAADEHRISLMVSGPSPLVADADPERLGQIVANLVENALKYAASTIDVEVTAGGGQLELRIRDDGPGIAAGDLPHVFERLYASRTTPGRQVGTGLGLAIVRELAAAMGGTATADVPTVGTVFVVRLPVLVTAPVEA